MTSSIDMALGIMYDECVSYRYRSPILHSQVAR